MTLAGAPDPQRNETSAEGGPRAVAGFFLALGACIAMGLVCLFLFIGIHASGKAFVVSLPIGHTVAGGLLYLFARRKHYTAFSHGVLLATAIVLLLDATCWSAF
jgi:hypothetical protein